MANEKRMISADEVLEVLCNYCPDDIQCPVGGCAEFQRIRRLLTVDTVEVVHGRWEFSHTTTVEKFAVVKCSNCGHEAFAIANYVKDGHYCPNCGAKMDGDGNG